MQPNEAVGLTACLVPLCEPLDGREIAGLAREGAAEGLTWDRVDALSLVRARSGDVSLRESLDPKALDEAARKYGVADFTRFRNEFLGVRTPESTAYSTAAVGYLDLLRRLQVIDDARYHIAHLENLAKLFMELIQGESAGLSQLHIDMVLDATTRARGRMSREIADYRSALDEYKVSLGLSPHASVVVDRKSTAVFQQSFDQVDAWHRRPDRQLSELPRIIAHVPDLGDVILNGRRVNLEPEPLTTALEDLLRDAAAQAIRHHQGNKAAIPDNTTAALELRVRRRVRRLIELRHEYHDAKRRLELATRLSDQTFERIATSSSDGSGSSRGSLVEPLIAAMGRTPEAQDRLINVWTTFRAERLELYHDLGTLPYQNWDVFHAHLAAAPAVPQAAAERPREAIPEAPLRTVPVPAAAPAAPDRRPGTLEEVQSPRADPGTS